jgi:hypothetical protein
MTLHPDYSALRPEFNKFLFAPIGAAEDGLSVTVFSALTELGMDPWKEAARLSAMSKEAASEALSVIIARVPNGSWAASELPGIASTLIELLPRRSGGPTTRRSAPLMVPGPVAHSPIGVLLLMILAGAALVLWSIAGDHGFGP